MRISYWSSDVCSSDLVVATVIARLNFDNGAMEYDPTGRVWVVYPCTEATGSAPWPTWPQLDETVYESGSGSFHISRNGPADQGFYYGNSHMSSVLGTAGALNGATDFCVEGFVRRDPLDEDRKSVV